MNDGPDGISSAAPSGRQAFFFLRYFGASRANVVGLLWPDHSGQTPYSAKPPTAATPTIFVAGLQTSKKPPCLSTPSHQLGLNLPIARQPLAPPAQARTNTPNHRQKASLPCATSDPVHQSTPSPSPSSSSSSNRRRWPHIKHDLRLD